MSSLPPKPTPIQLDDPGFYKLPVVREYSMLAPAVDGQEARIRVRLAGAITLDLPMPRKSLIALEQDLSQYLAKSEGD